MTLLPKVSVIIPTCNGRDSVERSVSSVLNQNFTNLEVIVVDDNVADTTQLLGSILKPDPRIRIVRNTGDHGPSQARNFGVSCALGELVTFLDDDDCYLEGRIQSLVNCYERSNNLYSFISSGRFVEIGDFSEIEPIYNQKFGVITLDDICVGNSIDIGFLMEARFFKSIGGFDQTLSSLEDWDLIIRALMVKDGYKIKRFDYVVNRTKGRARVSQRETDGYFDIADKYSEEFGEAWAFIPRAKGLSLSGQLSFIKAVCHGCRALSLHPIRLYLSSSFPRIIRYAKKVVSG